MPWLIVIALTNLITIIICFIESKITLLSYLISNIGFNLLSSKMSPFISSVRGKVKYLHDIRKVNAGYYLIISRWQVNRSYYIQSLRNFILRSDTGKLLNFNFILQLFIHDLREINTIFDLEAIRTLHLLVSYTLIIKLDS